MAQTIIYFYCFFVDFLFDPLMKVSCWRFLLLLFHWNLCLPLNVLAVILNNQVPWNWVAIIYYSHFFLLNWSLSQYVILIFVLFNGFMFKHAFESESCQSLNVPCFTKHYYIKSLYPLCCVISCNFPRLVLWL